MIISSEKEFNGIVIFVKSIDSIKGESSSKIAIVEKVEENEEIPSHIVSLLLSMKFLNSIRARQSNIICICKRDGINSKQ